MEQIIIDLDDYIVQRSIKEFPECVKAVLSNIFDDIREGNTQGRAPEYNGGISDGWINYIPSKQKGDCCPILIGVCYDKDNFENRVMECLDHASINCSAINREIFIFTTQWNSLVANKLQGYINALRRDGKTINMIYITNMGIALMPV